MYYIYYSTDVRYMYCIIFLFSPVVHRIDYVFVCYKKLFFLYIILIITHQRPQIVLFWIWYSVPIANAISSVPVTSKKVMSIMGNTGEQPFFNTTEVLQQISKKSLLYTILLSHKQINGTHYRTLTYTIIETNFIYINDLTNRLTLQRQGKWRHY